MEEYNWKAEEKLEQLAHEDHIYRVWQRAFDDCTQPFAEFANSQPVEIQQILWGYADGGRLMQQRKVNLACQYMAFKE